MPNLGPIHTPAGHLTVPNPKTSMFATRKSRGHFKNETCPKLKALGHKIPKRKQLHRKPWITEDTLKLISDRSLRREAGDLARVADFNKQIRKAAKNGTV